MTSVDLRKGVPPTTHIPILSLGGMMIAKAFPHWQVTLTDLPLLIPLLTRNVALNFTPLVVHHDNTLLDPRFVDYVLHRYGDPDMFSSSVSSNSRIKVQVLEWSEEPPDDSEEVTGTYDVIVAADVVASIYNPIALARTIHRLSHSETTVYISFKERLSSIHRQFECKLSNLFHDVEFMVPHATRNRNQNVQLLVARHKKY